jgi:hypothetical protein
LLHDFPVCSNDGEGRLVPTSRVGWIWGRNLSEWEGVVQRGRHYCTEAGECRT